MASGGFEIINNGETQYGYKVSVDYDEMEFVVNNGKPQVLNRDDFVIKAERE